ncbi:MAG: replication and repair protein RecF protein [Candidatus Roizmanbacteria bacterium GW2011_GWA2_35_19]|uniref:DNA replication and repair protein RecF n=2 Tax=Candidatus Roizmaniibacteriota TaxID=1752723 RepID=A0A0G0BU95_9BACT|nr:MAG: replication and repair protein RecF protein [Candidatus Roizmanbacteria bacterium GW2011_GWC2_35_12]KKP72873.1 MAG: replication and repair protein RecF protein [Candidatus Roizmanbacteria bacterium GW2011_GWA2_35_19]
MILKKISLHNFRNFDKFNFELSPEATIIIGKNSKGKTNLLESIHFIITGTGFREEKEEELIGFHKNIMDINSVFADEKNLLSFQIILDKKNEKTKKTYFDNKTKRSPSNYKKELPGVVLFTPEQIDIIKGSPSQRRDYFNKIISFFDLEYKTRLNNYEQALRKRNKILEKNQRGIYVLEELDFWNRYLQNEAEYITYKRQEYIEYLNTNQKLDSKLFSIQYLKNEFTIGLAKQSLEKEIYIRRTIIGPQKDDFKIMMDDGENNKNIHFFGSRSEERLAVFWLKINELKYHEEKRKSPILLLDDIFSELDMDNKNIVLSLIKKYQTVATTTENGIVNKIKSNKEVINL